MGRAHEGLTQTRIGAVGDDDSTGQFQSTGDRGRQEDNRKREHSTEGSDQVRG